MTKEKTEKESVENTKNVAAAETEPRAKEAVTDTGQDIEIVPVPNVAWDI